MKRLRIGRPSPALLVAVLALVAGLTGTALAGGPGAVASKLTKSKVKTISQKQANKVLKQQAPNLEVGSAVALTQLEYVQSNVVTVNAGEDGSAIANCPAGKFATGGGGAYPAASGVQVINDHPTNGNVEQAGYTGWEYRIRNGSAVPRNLRAYVICASLKAASGQNPTPSNYTAGESTP
jgi:hypothetical protein